MTWWRQALREPLLHFVVIGGVLFLLAGGGSDGEEAPDRIVISQGQIRNLAAVFERTWQRPPSDAELAGLIEERIEEEVLAREAMKLGLDDGDTVIRRRLRQKMEFVTEDLVALEPAGEAELQAYLEANRERFALPGRVTFTQVFLDRERRGRRLDQDARGLIERLETAQGADPRALGDPSLLQPDHVEVTLDEVERRFGGEFASRLRGLPVGRWVGPVPSPYGEHLIRIDARSAPSSPSLDEVRAAVARDLETERRRRAQDSLIEAMRARYEVVVERLEPALAAATRER